MNNAYKEAEALMALLRGYAMTENPEDFICLSAQASLMNRWADAIEQLLQETAKPEYQRGYEYAYKTAIRDVVNKMKEMEWYGGDHKEERAAGVPEHHAAGAGADE